MDLLQNMQTLYACWVLGLGWLLHTLCLTSIAAAQIIHQMIREPLSDFFIH
jgi:hypothetical protein